MVVIGAGLSGLAAADSLKTHDPSLQVIVLEASDRVGGRTVSGTIGDKSFDLGGQWILPEHKPLLQVRKLCTKLKGFVWSKHFFLNFHIDCRQVGIKDGSSFETC